MSSVFDFIFLSFYFFNCIKFLDFFSINEYIKTENETQKKTRIYVADVFVHAYM